MQKEKSTENNIEQMFKEGVHYGYSKSKRHPSVSSYIYTTKNKSDIINLEETSRMLKEAEDYIKELASQGKKILLVGTKPEAKKSLLAMAEETSLPYVAERWIGGTLTNFLEIKKRITELENYKKDKEEGNLDKYTKKELSIMSKKMEKLSRYYEGLIPMRKLPDAIFIIDPREESIAKEEAVSKNIPIIALSNSDGNIKNINFPIVGNDTAVKSIKFFTENLGKAYKENFTKVVENTIKK